MKTDVEEGTAVENVGPVRRAVSKLWPIATDVVTSGTVGLADYEREQLRWLQKYAVSSNQRPEELVQRIVKPDGEPYSWDALYQSLIGKRGKEGVNLRPLADAIARFRRTVQEVEARATTSFIETPLTRKLFKVFHRAREKHRIAFVMGAAQIGKTSAAGEYARKNNHGETFILRLPTRGTMGDTYVEFAVRLGIPAHKRVTELRRRIIESFDENNLLIIDEAHQCLYGRYSDTQAMVLEFIREIHDRRKCGVVFVGTNVLRQGLLGNSMLTQLWRRRSPGLVVQLPDDVPAEDMDAFAAAFGLEPAPNRKIKIRFDGREGANSETFEENPLELQTKMVRSEGLGSWIRLLEDARDLAEDTQTSLNWSRVLATYCLVQ